MNTKHRRVLTACLVCTTAVVVCLGIFGRNDVTKNENPYPEKNSQTVVTQRSNNQITTAPVKFLLPNQRHSQPNSQSQQPTFNSKPITANDWHQVGQYYYVHGIISKISEQKAPSQTNQSAWNAVCLKIDKYVTSTPPKTDDGSMQIGSSSLFMFYDLVDKGQDRMHAGYEVIMKVAQYTTPSGKIVWGCKYDDVYYKTAYGFVNNGGNSISK